MRTMGLAGLDELVAALGRAGYEVYGPRSRDGAIVLVDDRGVVWIRDTTATVLIPAATP